MKTIRNYGLMAFVFFMAFALIAPQSAYAAGTAAGVTISNEATVDYNVGGAAQGTLFSCEAGPCTEIVSTDTTDFIVDRKVNFTVAWGEATSPKTVFTNSTAVMLYTITNIGNTPISFDLAASITDGIVTSNILTTTTPVFYLDDGDDTWDAGDTVYAFADYSANETFKVWVTAPTVAAVANGEQARIDSVTVTALDSAGYAGTGVAFAPGGAATGTAVVYAEDGLGVAGNGVFTYAGAELWQIGAPVLTVQKSKSLVDDGFGGTAGYVPGSIVEYTLRIEYASGTGDVTNLQVTDTLPSTLAGTLSGYGTDEVTRQVVYNNGTDTGVVQLDSVVDAADVTFAGTAGETIVVKCGDAYTLTTLAVDYCEVKFKATIQ